MIESLPSRGAWIEILYYNLIINKILMSLPSRGAWIEILTSAMVGGNFKVAPFTGSVD